MTELASRPLLGYPDATVSLHIEGNEDYRVHIEDRTGLRQLHTTSPFIAKEWYFHPFVYGYEYPAHNSTTNGEDGA